MPKKHREWTSSSEDVDLFLNRIQILKYLGRKVYVDLSEKFQTVELKKGDYLFREGKIQKNLFVVKCGQIELKITDQDGSETIVHEVTAGGIPCSLISVIDVMMNRQSTYTGVQAVATSKTTVIVLSISDLLKVCRRFPFAEPRLALMVSVFIQRVIYTAMYNFLGLDKGIFDQTPNGNDEILAKAALVNWKLDDVGTACLDEVLATVGIDSASKYLPVSNSITQQQLIELGEFFLSTATASYGERTISTVTSDAHKDTKISSKTLRRRKHCETTLTKKESPNPLLHAAQQNIAQLFGLTDHHSLDDLVSIASVHVGHVLAKEHEVQANIYYILSGEAHSVLALSAGKATANPNNTLTNRQSEQLTKPSSMLVHSAGELIGLLGVVTGEANNSSILTTCPTELAVLPKEHFFSLIRSHPSVLMHAIYVMSKQLSPLLRLAAFALQWHVVEAGTTLYTQGDASKYIYIVLNGRFREVHALSDGSRQVVGEMGRGSFIGFVEVASEHTRLNTVHAIMESEVVQIPWLMLQWLRRIAFLPVSRLIQLLSDRIIGTFHTSIPFLGVQEIAYHMGTIACRGSVNSQSSSANESLMVGCGAMANLRTMAIIPASSGVNADAFCLELQHAASVFAGSLRLNHGDSDEITLWNMQCVRRAECIVVLASASGAPNHVSAVENYVRNHASKVKRLLVLAYPLETDYPPAQSTAVWLNARPWVNQHYHIRCPSYVLTDRRLADLARVDWHGKTPNPHSDISRLVRYLLGHAVGLVFGGGGARGAAHLGVIRAFQDAGIPIDMVGGTSIGALVGALWAEETRVTQSSQRIRDFALHFKSIWPILRDVTYPKVSIFSGFELNKKLEKLFKDRQIEDLWLPYFCVTTDITNCRMRVHTSGSLWRYVRSSMSLARYMPPLCDPYDGSYLLDGGYVNNLPVDVMTTFGAKTIYAVDVGSVFDTHLTNYGDGLSGWWVIYKRMFRRRSQPVRVPNRSQIQDRLAYLSCIRQLEMVKNSDICHFLQPPIQQYGTLQFADFDEITAVGHKYAKQLLKIWKSSGLLQQMMPGVYWPEKFNTV